MSSDASTLNKLLGSPQVRLWHTASTIKECEDVKLPYPLKVWNYSACPHHETPDASCVWHLCGGDPFKHQNKTAAFSYKSRKSIVGNSTGTGKQQPISEPVLTPTGWRAIGDLKAGDLVMGANGKPTEVLQVHPQTERRTYKVTFNDGSWTLAGPEHLWLAGTKSGLSQGGRMKVVNTLKMLETIHRSWVIPQVEPIQYPQDGPLPCDPYLLGVCLGDGSVGKYGTITLSTDMEILDRLGISPTRDHKTSNFTKYAVVEKGLLNDSISPQSRSWSKVIPERFMRATPEQRLDLLRGLMDTDGTPQHTGGTEYSTTSEVLAHQVQELAESLGGVARISGHRVTKYTHNGEVREGRPSWRVNVKLPTGINPFYLTRKAEKYIMPTKYPARRIVESIEQVEDQDSVCISVSAEDSLYVTRHHIVTHNTLSALLTLALAAHYGEPVRAIIVVPTISVKQWHAETSRWTPGFDTVSVPAKTPKRDRIQTYASKWNILIMGYHAFTKDVKYLEKVGILQVISDDIDPALSVNNKTFQALESLCRKANLVVVQNATALQVNLLQLYASSRLIGGGDIWGSERNFQQMYVRKEKVTVISKSGKKINSTQAVGYKNLAQPLTSNVLTPYGWSTIGSLKVGDKVVDSKGGVQTVEYISEQGVKDVWRVTLRDGSTSLAAGDHLWDVKCPDGKIRTLETKELVTRYNRGVQIPVPHGMIEGTSEPKCDPYLMGVLIGDGHVKGGVSFVCNKNELDIIDNLALPDGVSSKITKEFTNHVNVYLKTDHTVDGLECSECGEVPVISRSMCRRCYSRLFYSHDHTNHDLLPDPWEGLKSSGIWGKVGVNKVMPDNWISWSFDNRLALLQGLLDADGSVDPKRGRITFVTISPHLARGVLDLARSLGVVGYVHNYSRESSFDPSKVSNHYRVSLNNNGLPLFKTSSKRDKLASSKKPSNGSSRTVVSVERVEDSEVRCIGVSSVDSLYITDDFMLTHNTHFKSKFSPMNIRITYDDITDDVQIPQLLTEQVYLEMSPRQRTRYTELQDAVRTVMNNKNLPASKKVVTALTAFTYGSQICSGTFCLKTVEGDHEPDAPDASPKLDWIIDKLNSDWVDEKVVVYAKFRGAISALQGRLQKNGIGFSTIWGVETDANVRQAEMDKFWQDPDTRVMIISVSGERSLNLQNASILVMWDLQLNPARVAQIAGRVRRVGSKHKRVFVFELLHENTQEDRYMASLAARQTLFDYVYDIDNTDIDQDQLLISKLDPDQVLRLIRP